MERERPDLDVTSIDSAIAALAVASRNARRHASVVRFVASDAFEGIRGQFDVIVSNPPYVRELEKAQMNANVLQHEPGLALYVEDDAPLIFYKSITDFAGEHLKDEGQLFF